jgi:hypothetical protein
MRKRFVEIGIRMERDHVALAGRVLKRRELAVDQRGRHVMTFAVADSMQHQRFVPLEEKKP